MKGPSFASGVWGFVVKFYVRGFRILYYSFASGVWGFVVKFYFRGLGFCSKVLLQGFRV